VSREIRLPEPCPICGKLVIHTNVLEWRSDGHIVEVEMECETEPDIDSDEWRDWHNGHYRMPYVDWNEGAFQSVSDRMFWNRVYENLSQASGHPGDEEASDESI